MLNIFIYALMMFTIAACSSSPRFTSANNAKIRDELITKKTKHNSAEGLKVTYNDAVVLQTVTGIASYYAHAFNGKVTYSGEIYDMYGISAAHQTYTMGTILRVTNTKNGKSVILEINDRMPFNPDRIIDLSLGTAKKLDMINDGLAKVKLEVLKFGDGKK